MSRLLDVRGAALLVLLVGVLAAPGCRKFEAGAPDPVAAIRRRVEPGFRPPADGLLTDAQLDLYVHASRMGGGSGRPSEATGAVRIDPAELAWVHGRIVEALLALDAKRVMDGALEVNARSLADLRAARRQSRDAATAARLDAEIAALERERASLRRGDVPSATSKNAARIALRRAEIEAAGR